MMERIVFILILLLLPAVGWADEYVLVMSKEDNVCQQMHKLYNEDLKKYGEVKYEEHKEFTAIKWEEKTFKLRPVGKLPPYPPIIENTQVAVFDINNDSKEEVIVYEKSMLSNNLIDVYEIFTFDVLEMINKNEIVTGESYFSKRLKHFSSNDGVSVKISDLSDESIKKLPERTIEHIEATKKMGRKANYFIGVEHNIYFLKFKNLFYVVFEGPRDIGPNESYKEVEQYSLISELQQDNTLKNQCLYLIEKDKKTERRK